MLRNLAGIGRIDDGGATMTSTGAILKRLTKTALLVSLLGLLLYGAVAAMAELEYGHLIIVLMLAVPLILLLLFIVFDAIRTGSIPVWPSAVFLRHEPLRFWYNVG